MYKIKIKGVLYFLQILKNRNNYSIVIQMQKKDITTGDLQPVV